MILEYLPQMGHEASVIKMVLWYCDIKFTERNGTLDPGPTLHLPTLGEEEPIAIEGTN